MLNVVPKIPPLPEEPPPTLERFFMENERRAYKVALMSTRKQADALDILQDAMMQMVTYYANHPPKDWRLLFQRVLHSKIMDWHRLVKRRSKWFVWSSDQVDEDEGPDLLDSQPSANGNPESLLENSQSMGRVVELVEALPLRQRQAFMLRIWEGFDVRETAEIMLCSEGSVKTHLSRALETLRAGLQDWR